MGDRVRARHGDGEAEARSVLTPGDALPNSLVLARRAVAARAYGDAERLLREVLAEAPDHREALDLIGFVLFFLDRSVEAEPFVRRAVELYPDHAYAWKGLGMHLVRLGRHDEGFGAIERATELRPDWFDPHWDYLVMARSVGLQERFDAMLERARSRFPQETGRLDGLLRQAPARP